MRTSIEIRLAGLLVAIAASTALHAAAEAKSRHSDAVLEVVTQQCESGIGNADFCKCAIKTLNKKVNPKYATLFLYTQGKNTVQFFDISSDIPTRKINKIESTISKCRQKHAPESLGLQ